MRIVVMGVTGSGKTTVGMRLADALHVPFVDGDSLHSEANIALMSAGTPLTDEDRAPWLADVGAWLSERESGVVACSALRRAYRDAIRAQAPDAVFVHLAAPESVLGPRVRRRARRDGHFARPELLVSQYDTLEPLEDDERGGRVDIVNYSPEGATLMARAIVDANVPR